MASLADLEEENPIIPQQAAEWRQARRESGEDPGDWAAFREQHFPISGAEQEAVGEPQGMADALAGEPEALIQGRRLLHPQVLRHAPAAPPASSCDTPLAHWG